MLLALLARSCTHVCWRYVCMAASARTAEGLVYKSWPGSTVTRSQKRSAVLGGGGGGVVWVRTARAREGVFKGGAMAARAGCLRTRGQQETEGVASVVVAQRHRGWLLPRRARGTRGSNSNSSGSRRLATQCSSRGQEIIWAEREETEWRKMTGGGFGLAGGSQEEWGQVLRAAERAERERYAQGKKPWLEAKDWENPEKPLRPGHLYAPVVDPREGDGSAGDPWEMDRRLNGPADCWRTPVEDLRSGQEVVGTVEALSFRCGAYVDFGCEYHGLVHLYEDDWLFNSDIQRLLRVGQKVRARISWLGTEHSPNAHRFRFPVELHLLDPVIDHLLPETYQRKLESQNFTVFETLKMAEVVGDDFWLSSSADLEQDNLGGGTTMLEDELPEDPGVRTWSGPRPIRFDCDVYGNAVPPWQLAEEGLRPELYPHPPPAGYRSESQLREDQQVDDPAVFEQRLLDAWEQAEALVDKHGLQGQVQWRALSAEDKKHAYFGPVGTFSEEYYPKDPDYQPQLQEGSSMLDHDSLYAPNSVGPVWAYYVDKLRPNWDPRYGPYPQEEGWPVVPPDATPMEGTVWQTQDEQELLQDYLNEGYY